MKILDNPEAIVVNGRMDNAICHIQNLAASRYKHAKSEFVKALRSNTVTEEIVCEFISAAKKMEGWRQIEK